MRSSPQCSSAGAAVRTRVWRGAGRSCRSARSITVVRHLPVREKTCDVPDGDWQEKGRRELNATVPEVRVVSVIAHRSDLLEEPGFRNEGVLRIGDDEVQVTTTWWNWARHIAWPLGLMTTDLSALFAGLTLTREVVITMRRDKIERVSMRPGAKPLPRVQMVGTREEDGQSWLCSFAYRKEHEALVEQLRSYVPPERVTVEAASS